MRLAPLQQHFHARLRRRVPWIVVLVFAVVFTGFQFLLVPANQLRQSGALLNTLVMPFVISFCYGFLSPLPWRWSGDDRARAPFWRGLAQALLFNTLIILLLVSVSWLMVRNASLKAEALGLGQGAKVTFKTVLSMNLLGGVPIMSIVGAIIAFSVITEEEKLAAEAKLEEAQWVLLRGQLSPHVLFNSLNGLAELVRQDPEAAEQALLDLSELYRALLRHGDRPTAPLGDERALVQRFLAVEGLRMGERLKVSWGWDSGLDAVEAPPFLLQPLVENALKHGIAPHPAGGEMTIKLLRDKAGLRLQVVNTGRGLGLVPGQGVGLRNLEARLKLAYGSGASFHLRSEGATTVAEVALEGLETRR
ncbi:sensor histidine kinase [Geothrix limicola]|nr:histidine kinase [Geothrix limicola]